MGLAQREIQTGYDSWGTPQLSAVYPAVPEAVATARRALRSYAIQAGANEEQADAVRLAASEALTNVVLYAYSGGSTDLAAPPGRIHVTAWLAQSELWILIGDDGHGLQADHKSSGLGLGLALISQVTDEFTILERSGGGIELRMRFNVGVLSG